MTGNRAHDPHFSASIAQLEALVEESRDDAGVLAAIAKELDRRTTERAARLRYKVSAILDGGELPLPPMAQRPAAPPPAALPAAADTKPPAPGTRRSRTPVAERMIALIDYVIATEKDKLKPITDVAQHGGFHRSRDELDGLPGVAHNCVEGGDAVWLRVERLVKSPPPQPSDPLLAAWISLPDDPARAPALRETPRLGDGERLAPGTPIEQPPVRDRPDDAEAMQAALAAYMTGPWAAWSKTEAARRRTIALYNQLFTLKQLVAVPDGVPVQLVCGIGYATLLRGGRRLRYPLLTVPMEIDLDSRSHAIALRPRLEARVAAEADPLDIMELTGVDEWRSGAQAAIDGLEDEPLSPFARETFEPVLQRAAALLDPAASYRTGEDGPLPAPGADLVITDAYGFFQRERRATQLTDDLRAYRTMLESGEGDDIPPGIAAFFTEPSTEPPEENFPLFRGVSSIPGVTSSDGQGSDLYFPKPFNAEQAQIVQRLAVRDGVVVQGPPGTGKTHTIANIISHYLARGKRVLVTSQKSPALKVLRDQLPPAVRPLAVSLLDSDREGLKQFQASVDTISERLQRERREDLRQQIKGLEGRIDGLHRGLAQVDREIEAIGQAALAALVIEGRPAHPVEAARELATSLDEASWLSDPLDERPEHDSCLSDEDYARLRHARQAVGEDLAYLDAELPPLSALADRAALASAHADLVAAAAIQADIDSGAITELRDARPDTLAQVEELERRLSLWRDARHRLASDGPDWALALWSAGTPNSDPVLTALWQLGDEAAHIAAEHAHFIARPVVLPDGWRDDAKLRECVAARVEGRSGLAFGGLFAGATKARLAAIRLRGEAPASSEDWQDVERFMDGSVRAARLASSWDHAVAGHAVPAVPDGLAGGREAADILLTIEHLQALRQEGDTLLAEARALAPGWNGRLDDPAACDALLADLRKHVRRGRLVHARAVKDGGAAAVRGMTHPLGQAFAAFFRDTLGDPGIAPAEFERQLDALAARLDALHGLAPHFATIGHTAGVIQQNGAPEWAARLRSEPAGFADPVMPQDWRARWRKRRLLTALERSDRYERLRALYGERAQIEADMRRAYEQAIEARTWLELKQQASASVLTALAEYARAVGKIGRGTGKSANRHRKAARVAANGAKGALPCWIMPHYRVSESLPPDLGTFDLVIVDEASQSTIAALPALFRARQVLVVGDDKQVSPDNVGRDMARADALAQRHLGVQVPLHAEAMREESSLYDLAGVIFGADKLMLQEHFRCAAPLIEFSKRQFYDDKLRPLRLSKASERLDPPLLDIFVRDGYRKGKTNPPEADCIVDQLRRIGEDPAFEGRSIGVTTLLGQEQAALIGRRVEEELGIPFIERYNLRVGDPTVFQGDERDVMFLSLVAAPGNASALSGLAYEQRFNVAASRARERMVLVRSVEAEHLSPRDELRRALLDHFTAPFPHDTAAQVLARERCESGFEREMFDLLHQRGFSVDTQVRVGSYRIDMVVEGEDDRRLAIECDGDRYHGPEQWSADMQRQRTLERAGWTVWRCFASRFVRERAAVTAELLAELARLGIAPRAASDRSHIYTARMEWSTAEHDDDAPRSSTGGAEAESELA